MTGVPAILGVPYDGSSSYMRGAAEGPRHIREAFRSESSNSWSESGIDLAVPGVLGDAGDVAVDGDDPRAAIEQAVTRVLEQGARPLVLGGDHSITYPIVRAVRHKHPRLAILHFDAHPDLYPEFQGDRYSHACPFARILEEKLADRVVQVGIRTMNGIQREQALRFGVEVIEMRALHLLGELSFEQPLYISIDVDVLDPAFAPGVSHREPGGLSTRQVIDIIQQLRGRIAGADLVELNPRADWQGIAAMTCAKLVKELAAKMLATD